MNTFFKIQHKAYSTIYFCNIFISVSDLFSFIFFALDKVCIIILLKQKKGKEQNGWEDIKYGVLEKKKSMFS